MNVVTFVVNSRLRSNSLEYMGLTMISRCSHTGGVYGDRICIWRVGNVFFLYIPTIMTTSISTPNALISKGLACSHRVTTEVTTSAAAAFLNKAAWRTS